MWIPRLRLSISWTWKGEIIVCGLLWRVFISWFLWSGEGEKEALKPCWPALRRSGCLFPGLSEVCWGCEKVLCRMPWRTVYSTDALRGFFWYLFLFTALTFLLWNVDYINIDTVMWNGERFLKRNTFLYSSYIVTLGESSVNDCAWWILGLLSNDH